MAEEVPSIPETNQEIPMEINTVPNILPTEISQEKQLENQNMPPSEPVVEEPSVAPDVLPLQDNQPNVEGSQDQQSEPNAETSQDQQPEPTVVPSETATEKPPEPGPEPEPPKVEEPPVKKINVFVKTPQEKESFEIEENAGVKDFKQLIAPKFNAEPDQLVLIFAGKIMDDSDTMQQHKVKDGLTIHLVIRIPETGPPRQSADISATPYSLGNLGGLVGLAQLGMGSANFMELQNQMQNELLTNPNVLRNLLDNPLVQELMTHTDVLRTLVMRNPQMQELIDR